MKKKLALLLSLAIAVSMTACQSATPQPEETPVETTTVQEEPKVEAKSFTTEEFENLRIFAPDAGTPDNPEEFGLYGELAIVNYGYEIANTPPMIYRSAFFAGDGKIDPETPEEFKEYATQEIKRFEGTNLELIRKKGDGASVDPTEFLITTYDKDITAYFKMREKYGVKYFNSMSYWGEVNCDRIDHDPKGELVPYYQPAGKSSFLSNWDQTYDPIEENEYPKILSIIERYINAKYLGSKEVYKEDFTEGFLNTTNFYPPIIKRYYNDNGFYVKEIKGLKIRTANFDNIAIPVIVEYTLCTETGEEHYTRDYLVVRRFYNEETDDFYYQLAYSCNSEFYIRGVTNDNDRYSAESWFLGR